MNDKTLPAGVKLAIKTAKDVLILDNKISVVGLAGKNGKHLLYFFLYPKFSKNK